MPRTPTAIWQAGNVWAAPLTGPLDDHCSHAEQHMRDTRPTCCVVTCSGTLGPDSPMTPPSLLLLPPASVVFLLKASSSTPIKTAPAASHTRTRRRSPLPPHHWRPHDELPLPSSTFTPRALHRLPPAPLELPGPLVAQAVPRRPFARRSPAAATAGWLRRPSSPALSPPRL